MARGIAIKDVDNKLQSLGGEEVIPISTGANEPEVVEVDTLKEYINEDIDTALESKQDVINDLATIRSGAALGATAIQSESDPTVHAWAKAEQKPSYTASEVGAVPTTRKVNNKALSSDITLTAADVNALPSSTVIPAAQIQSDWNQSNTSAKDYIKNKPEIPVLPTLADVATSGDYEDLTNTPTIPDVPDWAMSSTKPSYTVSEIDGAQEELVSGTNIRTINGTSILGNGNITIEGGGGGDVNVIESITFNGSAVPVDSSKNAAITYSAPVTSVNGNTGAVTISVPTKVSDLTNDSGFITSYTETDPVFSASVAASITSADITAWNGKSTFSGSYNDLTDKPTLFSGAYADLTGKPNLATVATSGDYDDLSNKPTIPTVPSNVSAFTNDAGYTTNTGTITSVKMNGSTIASSGEADLGTVLTSHQDISGKADKVTSATNGNFAALDSNGNLTDSGHKHSDYLTSHQDLSNYVQKSSTAGLLKNDGTVDTSTYLTQHQDLSNYIQKSSTSGLVKNDGTIDTSTYLTQHQDISNYIQKSNTAGLVKNDGTIDTSTYLTTAPVTSVNGQTGAVSLTIPTVPSNLVTGTSSSYTIWAGTQAQYEAIATKDATTIYLITES